MDTTHKSPTPVHVTQAYLPDFSKYTALLERIWESYWLTNNGALLQELEARLKSVLTAKYALLTTNGTLALQLAIRGLGLTGKVITTPFSYVATVSSLAWEQCTPVLVDIEPTSLCLDPNRVEAALKKSPGGFSAIVPTHVYGNACDTDAFAALSQRYGIPVLYDAAHAFGAVYKGKSLATYGKASILSFHATKLFHTIEGGAIVTDDDALAERIGYLRNFGHDGQTAFNGIGINAKMSEFQAAMGLCVLDDLPMILESRQQVSATYDRLLAGLPVRSLTWRPGLTRNHAYYPILFESEPALLAAVERLNAAQIFPRRYFYPSLSVLPYVEDTGTPIATDVASRVLCLPLHPTLEGATQKVILKNIFEKARI